MSAVTGTGKHHKIAVDLSGKQNGIPVEGKEGIFHTDKGLEICRFCHTDGCPVEILAPDDVISVLHLYQTGIVGIYRHKGLSVLIHEMDLFLIKIPVNAIPAPSKINEGNAVGLLTAENADESALVRHDCAVEDSCHLTDGISADDRIFTVTPDRRTVKFLRSFLPGYIGYGCS